MTIKTSNGCKNIMKANETSGDMDVSDHENSIIEKIARIGNAKSALAFRNSFETGPISLPFLIKENRSAKHL